MKIETGNNNVKISKLSNAFQSEDLESENDAEKSLKVWKIEKISKSIFRWHDQDIDSMAELENLINDSNINSMDESGMTLLHKSIISDRVDFVRTLIGLGANLRLSTRDGWSALHLAAFLGFNDILIVLINSLNEQI